MQSRGVRRPSVCPFACLSVNIFAQIASSTTEVAGSPPNLHTMVPRKARIQGVLKVKVRGHVIRTLFWLHENRFFYHKHDWIATKLAHDSPQAGLHPGCAQGQGQRSRDTGTSVMSRNVCYTVWSHVLPLHALTSWNTIILPFQYKYQAARCLNIGMSYSVIDGLVIYKFSAEDNNPQQSKPVTGKHRIIGFNLKAKIFCLILYHLALLASLVSGDWSTKLTATTNYTALDTARYLRRRDYCGMQSRLGGHTHRHRAKQYLLRSLMAAKVTNT